MQLGIAMYNGSFRPLASAVDATVHALAQAGAIGAFIFGFGTGANDVGTLADAQYSYSLPLRQPTAGRC